MEQALPLPRRVAAALAPFWSAVGGPEPPAAPVEGSLPGDASAFRTALAATASCAAVHAASAEWRGEAPSAVDPVLALANFVPYAKVNGERLPSWANLSGYYRAKNDRFVQLHCNFPHHAAGAARVLRVPEERAAFETAIEAWDAFELETALVAEGAIGAACRTLPEWNAHPHAAATRGLPLLDVVPLGSGASPPKAGSGERPLEGVRVIDCTRVLAGPMAAHTLACLGAEVIRIGAPHLPVVEVCVICTGSGKSYKSIDLRSESGRRRMRELLSTADVWLDAFRPGALAAHGFDTRAVSALNPSLSIVQISAFDWVGPWACRRGFDSIVQSATGITMAGADACGADSPTPLPVQALDYATGYFAAAAAIRSLTRRRESGRVTHSRLSLIRTRNWLTSLGEARPFEPAPINPPAEMLETCESGFGKVELVKPFIGERAFGPRRLTAT